MQHIASISYGKDSLAQLEVIFSRGLPIDRIVHVEIMATQDIPADLPELMKWKQEADIIIKKRYGIQVEHIKAEKTFEELFYEIPIRTEKNKQLQGCIRGFPSLRSQWCTRDLKVRVMKNFFRDSKAIQYIGIAADETDRLSQLSDTLRSPLFEAGIEEKECKKICEQLGLLAPIYIQSKRSGCWFCNAQPIEQLRILRKKYPQLWEILLKWDSDSPIPFRHGKRHGTHTVGEFDKRFLLEDIGVIRSGDKSFRWSKMAEYEKR